MYKNLSEIAAQEKTGVVVVVPKKPFSSCRLLRLIEGNNFFLSTGFLCFMKDESSWGQPNHPSIDAVFFGRTLAVMYQVYTINLTDIPI